MRTSLLWRRGGGCCFWSSVLNCSLSCLMRSRDERLGADSCLLLLFSSSSSSCSGLLLFFFFSHMNSHFLLWLLATIFFFPFVSAAFFIYIVLHSLILQPMQMEHGDKVHCDRVFAVMVPTSGFIGYAFKNRLPQSSLG